jgi:hypothetical protein
LNARDTQGASSLTSESIRVTNGQISRRTIIGISNDILLDS